MQQHLWEKQTTDCAVSCPRLPPSASATSLSLFKIFNQNFGIYRVSQKNALSKCCCWTHSALAQSPVADTPCVLKSIFWSFLNTQDQALPSHVHGKIWLNFGYDFFLLVPFFGTPCIYKQLSILIDDSVTWRSKLPDFCVLFGQGVLLKHCRKHNQAESLLKATTKTTTF